MLPLSCVDVLVGLSLVSDLQAVAVPTEGTAAAGVMKMDTALQEVLKLTSSKTTMT